MQVYTDGSTTNNGKKNAVGGSGVWFGEEDTRNLSEPYGGGDTPTNQRCELWAIRRALETTPIDTPLRILTDSKYCIGCLTVWCKNWTQNGWQTSGSRRPVKNATLIRPILALMEHREVAIEYVKAHANIRGNEEADRLANEGRVRYDLQ
jgi:ribonuclease HI